MCTQDLIIYRCMHFSKGEIHPCKDKQERPKDICMWEAIRRLELRQQCKKCTTNTVGRRIDSGWSYSNNEEYQRRIGNTRHENGEDKNDNYPNIAINFAFKPLSPIQPDLGRGKAPDTTQWEVKDDGMKDHEDKSTRTGKGEAKERHRGNIKEKEIAGNLAGNFEVKAPTGAQPEPELHRAIAMYPFSSTLGHDCFFEKGDQIAIYYSVDAEWWWGINLKTMAQGLLPKSYVLILNSSIPRSKTPVFPLYENDVGEALLDYVNN